MVQAVLHKNLSGFEHTKAIKRKNLELGVDEEGIF